MYNTFNMGVGMSVTVPREPALSAITRAMEPLFSSPRPWASMSACKLVPPPEAITAIRAVTSAGRVFMACGSIRRRWTTA